MIAQHKFNSTLKTPNKTTIVTDDLESAQIYEKALSRATRKDWGKLDEFKRKELVKEYNRKVEDLNVKMNENMHKKKVMDILHKQRAELDAEYAQVFEPIPRQKRPSTAKKSKTATKASRTTVKNDPFDEYGFLASNQKQASMNTASAMTNQTGPTKAYTPIDSSVDRFT